MMLEQATRRDASPIFAQPTLSDSGTYHDDTVPIGYKLEDEKVCTISQSQYTAHNSNVDLLGKFNEYFSESLTFDAASIDSISCIDSQNSSLDVEVDIDFELQIQKLKSFVVKGQIKKARQYLSTIQSGDFKRINYWKKVLAEPKVKVEDSATGQNLDSNLKWLKSNSKNYKGKWVALKDGYILGSDKSHLSLHNALKNSGELQGSTFILISA